MKSDTAAKKDAVPPQSHLPRRARRISLSSGPGTNPAPPPRSQQLYVSFRRSIAVVALALLWELWQVATGRSQERRNGSRPFYSSVWFLGPLCCLMLSEIAKAAVEEKLAERVRRKLRRKLEDSFKGGQSVVNGVWVRAGVATSQVGFALAVDPPPSPAEMPDRDNSPDAASPADAGEVDATTAAADGASSYANADHLLAVREGACDACWMEVALGSREQRISGRLVLRGVRGSPFGDVEMGKCSSPLCRMLEVLCQPVHTPKKCQNKIVEREASVVLQLDYYDAWIDAALSVCNVTIVLAHFVWCRVLLVMPCAFW